MRIIYADSEWLEEGFVGPIHWAQIDKLEEISHGIAETEFQLPSADETRFIVSSTLLSSVEIDSPSTNTSHRLLLSALPFLVEDDVIDDIDHLHIVLDRPTENNRLTLFYINKKTLDQIIQTGASLGIFPSVMTPEPLFIPHDPENITVFFDTKGGFMRIGRTCFNSLDITVDGAPPVALLITTADSDKTTASISLYLAPNTPSPDIDNWKELLSTDIKLEGERHWIDWCNNAEAWTVNFLSGDYTPPEEISRRNRTFKTTAILLIALCAVWVATIIVDWQLLSHEETLLDRTMETALLTAFPETRNVIDPPFQMQEKLNEFRGKAGITSRDSVFLNSLLAVEKSVHGRILGISDIAYRSGKLSVTLAMDENIDPNQLIVDLGKNGLRVLDTKPVKTEKGLYYRFDMMWGRL